MQSHEMDANASRWCKECDYDYNGPCTTMTRDVQITPLSLAVHYGAVVRIYLIKEMDARLLVARWKTLQFCAIKYGRDSLITRLARGEQKKIAKSYQLGFAALRYYADSQRASLLLARRDNCIWLILKGLAALPVELRQKIVDFAFFRNDAPERKANKRVQKSM